MLIIKVNRYHRNSFRNWCKKIEKWKNKFIVYRLIYKRYDQRIQILVIHNDLKYHQIIKVHHLIIYLNNNYENKFTYKNSLKKRINYFLIIQDKKVLTIQCLLL